MNIAQTQENHYNITLPAFEGPLDLLLHLIRENQIDIYDIPIAKVCEQYLAYLSLMESLDLELAGEWLVMAATLLEIKSRMLLPEDPKDASELEEEQIDPRLELVERLIEYERFKSAAEIFKEREEQRARVFVRGATELPFDLKPTFDLENITAVDLLSVLQRILADVGEEEVTSIQKRKITVRMRMREIQRKLIEAAGQLKFEELFDDSINRIEVVITFLALLELLKSHIVKVKQKSAFLPIEITAMESNGR
ncbi:segregation/condensation protein A [bacterium]|nr:segregation/condensation protein A [bacterium]